MNNAIYKGKLFKSGINMSKSPNYIGIRSKYKQEEEGFFTKNDTNLFYKYVNPAEIDAYYKFQFYAVYGDVKCNMLLVSDDMKTMDIQEHGGTLRKKYSNYMQPENGYYIYSDIPIMDADSILLEIEQLKKPDYLHYGKKEEIKLTYEEFLKKYRSMVLDV